MTPDLPPHISHPIFPLQVQADLVRMGALKMLLERAGTGGADNSDIRSLALQTLQHVASHGANMAALRQPEVINRLKGLATVLASDAVVVRSVSAILRSIETISTLLELQGKQARAILAQFCVILRNSLTPLLPRALQRALRAGEVASMIDCIGVAGVDASISREVAHTCAAIGAQKSGVPLFLAEGGLELLNNLAKSKNIGVQIETAAALCEFARVADAHRALHKGGSLAALVGLARSRNPELQRHVAVAFAEMAERRIAKTWIVQVTRRRSHHYHRLTHQHHHHLHLTSPHSLHRAVRHPPPSLLDHPRPRRPPRGRLHGGEGARLREVTRAEEFVIQA